MFIRGETPSAHGALPRKIPGWVVVVREHFSVNKRDYRKQPVEIVLSAFLSVFFSNFTFGFEKVKIIQSNFCTGAWKKNLVGSNKDNRVFMSRNYRSDSTLPLGNLMFLKLA